MIDSTIDIRRLSDLTPTILRSSIPADDPRLMSIDELLLGATVLPSHWDAELESGWPGSNGSSCSTDRMFWMLQIGHTTREYSVMPADLHDLRYRALRRLLATGRCSEAQWEVARRVADECFRNDMLNLMDYKLSGWYARPLRAIGRERALIRYDAVRDFGASSARPRPADEGYPA
jgi:hypothetical protein